MPHFPAGLLAAYWSATEIQVNALIFLNLLGSLLLGLVVGYERSYRGRAAGMRTFGLVCMASCALTVFTGYPSLWFAGHFGSTPVDPTRVVQGIVTGIGFLGAGVIMKNGFSISGLSTAASIWACSAIGVLVGVGFYGAAVSLAALCAFSMGLVAKIESRLPHRESLQIVIAFAKGYAPDEARVRAAARERGYEIPRRSIAAAFKDGRHVWTCEAVSIPGSSPISIAAIAKDLAAAQGVEEFDVGTSRH